MFSGFSTMLRSSTSPSTINVTGKDKNAVKNEGKERTTSSFAAAQQLFRRQQTLPLELPPSYPTSPSRHRSYTTSSSLYSKLEKSMQDTTAPEERMRAVSGPVNMSIAESFTPWQAPSSRTNPPVDSTCILPGPKRTSRPFDMTTVKGTTAMGAPAWWCRHDKLVVFDGIRTKGDEKRKHLITRTSKGLEVSRKRSPKEVISMELGCSHCRDMLGKKTWTYETRVMESKVCQRCQQRCWREVEKQELEFAIEQKKEVNKKRDSVLSEIDYGSVHALECKNINLRKVQSDRNLGLVLGQMDGKLERRDQKIPTHAEATHDLRKVKSDHQLQNSLLKFTDQLLSAPRLPTPQN